MAGAAALPFSAVRAAAVAAPAVPPTAYAWAHLIVRAQAKADPAMLARQLKLSPDVAQTLFDTLIRDGVLRAPGAAGVAQAVQPLQTTGHRATAPRAIQKRIEGAWETLGEGDGPLVKEDDPALECRETPNKDARDASTPEPLQESPQSG